VPLASTVPTKSALVPTKAALRLYYFITFASMGLYLPFFPTWLRARGFVSWQMGTIMAIMPVCQMISPAIVGMIADKLALRGRMMTVCCVTTALGLSAFTASAGLLEAVPFLLACFFMLAFALMRSPIVGLADVLAMEIAPDYGRMRLFGSMGFMVAALLGGRLLDPTHPTALPGAVAGLIWLLTIVSLLLPKTSSLPPRPALSDARALLSQTAYRRLVLTMMFIFGGMTAYDLCLTLRLRELSASGTEVGLFWSVATCSEVILLFFAGRFINRVGPGKLLTFALVVATGRWLFLSQAEDLTLMLLLQPVHAIVFGLMWVSSIAVLKREVGEKGTATAQGLFSSFVALGAAIGLSSWGTVYDAIGSEIDFLGAACDSGIAELCASTLIRHTKPGEENAPVPLAPPSAPSAE
jgi:PPP family 3-phenylpropionic acid transporter